MIMQENILKRVRDMEQKNGIHYAKTNDKLYKITKIIYILLFALNFFLSFSSALGLFFEQFLSTEFHYYKAALITIAISIVVFVIGFILSFTKLKFTASIITLISSIFILLSFAKFSEDEFGTFNLAFFFYLRHFLPMILLLIALAIITYIAVNSKIKTERNYKKVLDNLYNIYKDRATNISDEEWNEFLEAFDPNDYSKLFKDNE